MRKCARAPISGWDGGENRLPGQPVITTVVRPSRDGPIGRPRWRLLWLSARSSVATVASLAGGACGECSPGRPRRREGLGTCGQIGIFTLRTWLAPLQAFTVALVGEEEALREVTRELGQC